MVESGFMVSADNAHARHPNYPEMSDSENAPTLGGGVVIKFNANQKYATDGVSAAVFGQICARAGVPTQNYCNRADLPGGSTLGSISDTCVSLYTVDIGLPQLAMHSSCETAATADVEYMTAALKAFYSTPIRKRGEKFDF
jgi:aspartyl aminopeptidase